ncbi:LytTR family DNA-binding domain-containing protein [Puia sp.]|jgi:DNA-binding LytR/AlgR family response regulator|uniref:LytR/AlgR family response regulator transcription factor n=1 Tax=Puia sp. TaxID=2045100 RepID=UPI002F407FCE
MQIDCIIIEDEPLAQERIRGYLERLPFLRLVGAFDNGIDALGYLQAGEPDLIFLDINMGDFSGIQLLESMKVRSQVIISTAYHEYALKGFDLQVADYLLKPYTFERFVQAIDRVRALRAKPAAPSLKRFLFVKTEYRLERLALDDLLYIEGMRDYRRIFARDKQIMTLQTFGELEQNIPPSIACRVHKSYMVALDKIDAVERDLIRIGTVEIPLSETYKKAFLQLLTG